jgi:hypothetical protein
MDLNFFEISKKRGEHFACSLIISNFAGSEFTWYGLPVVFFLTYLVLQESEVIQDIISVRVF